MQLKNVFKIVYFVECVGLAVSYLLIGVLIELFITLTAGTNNYFGFNFLIRDSYGLDNNSVVCSIHMVQKC